MGSDNWAICWRVGLLAVIVLGLMLLASSVRSQSPQGVIVVFLFSLFISLGFLLFGRQRFEITPAVCRADTEHSA
ncbi:MAG: hypothetical protein Q7J46_04985 [Pseudomonas sp.]|jgi:predicted membrane channel-forming protein YqfA (hemolysin III family)|nr:hypothetical protein [Pseudomonas sp.]